MQSLKQDDTVVEDIDLSFESIKKLKDKTRFWIHETGGNIYIFDQHTGDVVEITDVLSDLIKSKTKEEFNAIKKKLSGDEITENGEFLQNVLDIPDTPVESDETKTKISVLKLNISSTCNLSCAYCFRDKEHNFSITDTSLIYKVINNMVDGFGREADSYTICFNLASEPLLYRDLMNELHTFTKKLQRKIRKRIEIFFVTNGTILTDKIIKVIKSIRKDRPVSISIDGPKHVHDKVRKYPDGTGSYDKIIQNIQLYKKKGMKLCAEGVITKEFPYPLEIIKHLMELGFESINLKPVRQGTPYSFDEKSIESLIKGYDDYYSYITEELLKENYYPLKVLCKDSAIKPLWRILFHSKMNRRCGWGINTISMDHKGDYYPCDSVMGMDEYRVGNVHDGIDFSKFHRDLTCEKRGQCAKCWARHLCSGTCYVNGILEQNDMLAIDPVECRLTKFLIESNLKMICHLLNARADMRTIKTILRINLYEIYLV
ncbi:MAG: SPASM domain-containing protein [Spirochaetales bacterium]|nr:SPASM domain-containing protein [Spirochaetales bacterium]